MIEYSNQTYHVFDSQPHFRALELWNSLDSDTQIGSHQAWKEDWADGIQELTNLYEKQFEEMKEHNVEMIELTDAQRQEWIDASQPLYEKYRSVIGEEYYDWFVELVDAKR